MKCVSNEVSAKIVNMSLLGALLVISIHCSFNWTEIEMSWWLKHVFSDGYSRIAVPFFFIVSGYFLSAHINERGWWTREVLKRVKSILVPFVVWALIYQIAFLPLSAYCFIRNGQPVIFMADGVARIFGLEWDKWPSSVPLWYLRALFIFVVVSPVIVLVLKKFARVWFVLLYIANIAIYYGPDPLLGGWSGFLQHVCKISGLMYFSFGLYIGMNNICYSSKIIANLSAVVGIMILVINGVVDKWISGSVFCFIELAIPFLLYSTWYYMPNKMPPRYLIGVSFPIYLMHMLFPSYWGILGKHLHLGKDLTLLLEWPIAFIGCILLSNATRRISPCLAKALFGGR